MAALPVALHPDPRCSCRCTQRTEKEAVAPAVVTGDDGASYRHANTSTSDGVKLSEPARKVSPQHPPKHVGLSFAGRVKLCPALDCELLLFPALSAIRRSCPAPNVGP
jgi:hypothetical protein